MPGVRGDPVREFEVCVPGPKTLAKLGVELGPDVVVRAVPEGALRAWGREHPQREVLVGDRIAEVNGKRCADTKALLRACKAEQLTLLVTGPCRPCDTVRAKAEAGDAYLVAPEWPPAPHQNPMRSSTLPSAPGSAPTTPKSAPTTPTNSERASRFGFFPAFGRASSRKR